MNMTKREFQLILTGLLCIILVVNILMKYFYPNEVIQYFLDALFFIIFGIGISDVIQRALIKP